ncbi:MAG: hypothetical protein KDA16_03780 [Phycisphaerales bacterium]|nr:hypothetical protein [Phycisphaerales bacterium]
MASLYRRLNRVRSLGHETAEAILDATLPHASPDERDAIVAELLDSTTKDNISGLEVVLRHWGCLSADARRASLVVGVDHMEPLVTRAVADGVPTARRAAGRLLSSIVAESSSFSAGELAVIAHACAELARDADPVVSGDAISALADLGARTESRDPSLLDVVDRALIEAADTWHEHRSGRMLEAIALRAHASGPLLREWLDRIDHPAHMALRGSARMLRPDELAPRLVRWLSIPALAPVATQRLTTRPTEKERLFALSDSHLLLNPRRRTAVSRMGNCEALLAGVPVGQGASSSRVGAVRWSQHARMNPTRRRALIGAVLTTGDPYAQWAGAQAMVSHEASREESVTLLDYALVADRHAAALAARTLSMTRSSLKWRACAASLRPLTRSQHESVRRTIDESARWRDPMRGVSEPWGGAVAARRLLATDQSGFINELRSLLTHGSGEQRMNAMRLARRLGLIQEVESELIAVTCGSDNRLKSMAVHLLARSSSPASRAAVESALRAPDGRVRATAVEVVARWRDRDAQLTEFVADQVARVRANAIVHFLSEGRTQRSATIAMHEMLSDARSGHRLSALWVAEVGGQTDLADRAREMAMHDDDPAVRKRAMRCARALTAMTRRAWSGSPADQPAGVSL